MKRRPSAYLFAAALLGTFFGAYLGLAYGPWLALALSSLMLMIISSRPLWRIGCFLAFTVLISASGARYCRESYDRVASGLPPGSALYQGIINELSPRADGSKGLLITTDASAGPFHLILTLREGAAGINMHAGQILRFKSAVSPMRPPLSPAYFDAYRYGLAHQIHGRATILDPKELMISEGPKVWSLGPFRQKLREHIMQATTAHQSGLLLALILGETSLFAQEQKEIYQNIGAQHLLAVSGLQVTLIAALVFFMLLPLAAFLLPMPHTHLSHILSALLTIIIVWFFVGLCQWPKSAIRAALMATMLLTPILLTRRIDIFDAFFGSGLLCLLLDPLSILDLGFLLSYSAVFGLIWAHQASAKLRENILECTRLGGWAFSLVVSSLAAFLATLPILAYYFSTISPMSALANLSLVPIASLLQIPAILFGIFGALLAWPWLMSAGAFFAMLIELVAEFLNNFLGQLYYWPELSACTLILAPLGLFLLFISVLKPKIPLMMLSFGFMALFPMELVLKNGKALVVTVIPVGQGDATLFALPNGQHLLVDAGGQMFGHFDPGLSIVVPTLRRLGVKSLEALLITHPDPDHILGAFAVIEHVPVQAIWHSGFRPDHPLTKRLLALAQQKNIIVKDARELLGTHRFGATEVAILAPKTNNGLAYWPELSANNNSVVLKIIHQGIALLWPGDLEQVGEDLLLANAEDLSAQVLKAPHHGSKTSSTPAFIDRVNPDMVIYSTGVANKFNFPHSQVVSRYQEHGVKSYNTARDGEITLRIADNKIAISTFLPAL